MTKKKRNLLILGAAVLLLVVSVFVVLPQLSLGPYATEVSWQTYICEPVCFAYANSPHVRFAPYGYEGEDVFYRIQVSKGGIGSLTSDTDVIPSGKISAWYIFSKDQWPAIFNKGYFTITVLEGEHIVGYAVVGLKIGYIRGDGPVSPENYPVTVRLLKSVTFPKQDGQYQPVTQEYVDKCAQRVIHSVWGLFI